MELLNLYTEGRSLICNLSGTGNHKQHLLEKLIFHSHCFYLTKSHFIFQTVL